jgi:hypothetical protein
MKPAAYSLFMILIIIKKSLISFLCLIFKQLLSHKFNRYNLTITKKHSSQISPEYQPNTVGNFNIVQQAFKELDAK